MRSKLVRVSSARSQFSVSAWATRFSAWPLARKSTASSSGTEEPTSRSRNAPAERILITSENHGWGIAADSLPDCLEITRLNLNDNCVEGLHHRELPIFSIQCHPEASPGPHDSFHLFSYFAELMEAHAS